MRRAFLGAAAASAGAVALGRFASGAAARPQFDHVVVVMMENRSFDHLVGWLRAGSNDAYAIGYYRRGDLAFLGQAAPQWTMVSPWARRAHVATRRYDHTSILRLIETRFALPPLTVRDATANDLTAELTGTADVRAPSYAVPAGPFGTACGAGPASEEEWAPLRDLAARTGWPV